MTAFNFEVDLPVRLRDIDFMGHVNNAVYATYLEQARVEYIEEVIGGSLYESGAVLASLEVDFHRAIDLGDAVTVAVAVPELGRTSVPMTYEVRSDGEVAATAETLMVMYDPEADESYPVPDDWREAIEAHEGL